MSEPEPGETASADRYDPFSREARTDPFPWYRHLRRHYRAYPLPQYDAWAIPRFDDVYQIGADPGLTSIREGPVFSRDQLLEPPPPPAQAPPRPLRSFSTLDPPVHTAVRKALGAPLRPGSVARLEEPLRADVRRLLADCCAGDGFDVVSHLANPAVAASTCRLLGIPSGDHPELGELVHQSLRRDPLRGGATEDAAQARADIHQYLSAWAREQRGRGGLVDALAAVSVEGGPLSDDEIAVQIATLLAGGIETVPKIVGGGVLALWHHPDQRAALVRDPGLVPDACEEIMRLEAPLQWVGRTLAVDAELAGVAMRAGQRLFLLLASANRDEREFEDSERFDIHRRPIRTLVFGHGPHFCIGAAAARLELRVLFEELLAHVPHYEVDLPDVVRPPSEFQLGYTAVPITMSTTAGGSMR